MSVSQRSQVNWAKDTAMRIMGEVEEAIIRQDGRLAERWNLGAECPEEQYKVKIGDADTLCDILHHIHTIHGPLSVNIEGHETNGDVWLGCYSEPNNKREATIRLQPKAAATSRTPNEIAPKDLIPGEALREGIPISETPIEETESSPTTSHSKRQSSYQAPTQEVEESPSLVAKKETADCSLSEGDYESVDLIGNTELNEEWVDVEYPAGSNGWWRVRQRARNHREGRDRG